MNPHQITSNADDSAISRAVFDEPTFNRLHGEHSRAVPADQRDGAASDGLTHAERQFVKLIGPDAARYFLPRYFRLLADRARAASEIGFGKPDA